ncbi:MAG: hypothetical protein HN583_10450 [Kordiimonadaceae bacterium]|nr:hypothetical protein [Kordiimonadaceae bacterium]MBT6134156.1 hypothetical protein [Kordiimonadaceae bacterium]MBT6467539.1 hypothetical protein [Kordiimonadaceae bacterium]MBT7606093.1 hypothetical protein [Kordiimonadaceae bacterium]
MILNSEVKKILQNEEGIEITYASTKNGKEKTITGDYCISTIPLPILSKTENNIES